MKTTKKKPCTIFHPNIRDTQVFSEKEAKRFPPIREWDHQIPLKPDALETINIKMFSLHQEEHDAI
jgi:hypothetical protein